MGQRALAAAGLPHDAENLPGLEVEVDVLEGVEGASADLVIHGEVRYAEEGLGHRRAPIRSPRMRAWVTRSRFWGRGSGHRGGNGRLREGPPAPRVQDVP